MHHVNSQFTPYHSCTMWIHNSLLIIHAPCEFTIHSLSFDTLESLTSFHLWVTFELEGNLNAGWVYEDVFPTIRPHLRRTVILCLLVFCFVLFGISLYGCLSFCLSFVLYCLVFLCMTVCLSACLLFCIVWYFSVWLCVSLRISALSVLPEFN